jgi:phosphotransferase system HPr (HPr) family protein
MHPPAAIIHVTVSNAQGLHARPADLFARLANRFDAKVELIKDGQRADGKSILEILSLAATRGSLLTIEARGVDAWEAVEALARLIEKEVPAAEPAD